MGPKRLQVHLILIFAACLALVGCGHGAPTAGSGGGGGGSSSSPNTSATADAGSNGGGGSGGGSDTGQSSGGGGAPIAIPNIIIRSPEDVYVLKQEIEQKAQQLCGGCITVVIGDTSVTKCLSSYTADPPIAGTTNLDYLIKRGTVITLNGGATCSPSSTGPPTTAPPTTAPATIPPTAPPTSPAA